MLLIVNLLSLRLCNMQCQMLFVNLVPSCPRNVQGQMLTASYLRVSWSPPLYPNGMIISYLIFYTSMPDQPDSTWKKHIENGRWWI